MMILNAAHHGLLRQVVHSLLMQRWPEARTVSADPDSAFGDTLYRTPNPDLVLMQSTPTRNWASDLKTIETRCPAVPCLVLADAESLAEAQFTFANGARGYIGCQQVANLLVTASELVLRGHTFLTPGVLHRCIVPPEALSNSLTKRQQEILPLLAEGLPNKEIARRLHISEGTAKLHVRAIIDTLKARNRAQAAVFAAFLARRPDCACPSAIH